MKNHRRYGPIIIRRGTASDVPSLIGLSADGPTGFSGLLVGFPHHPSPSLVGLSLSLVRFFRHALVKA